MPTDGKVPLELQHQSADEQYHQYYRENGDLREPYAIANKFLLGTQLVPLAKIPEAPTIVFINSKSGGRAGPNLSTALRHALGYSQVFDLNGTNRPDKILEVLRRNFDADHSELSAETRSRLRIIAAGGDGTVAWILQSIKRLKIQPPPPVAVIPLGTGNDLSRQFGWGGEFKASWIKNHKSIYDTMKRVADAVPEDLDCWQVKMTAPDDSYFEGTMPYGFVHDETDATPFSRTAYSWNYVSVGMDAKAAYGFHHLRNTKPQLAFSRSINQFWYSYFSCSSGWFCCTKDLERQVPLLAMCDAKGNWTDVPVPKSVKALIILNLQSYGAGRNIWGTKKDDRWATPKANDGLLEVVGFGNGWHTATVMGAGMAGMRIAQGHGVRLRLRGWRDTGDATSKIHLQLDGEPWRQKIPNKVPGPGQYLELEVTHANTSRVLHNYPGKAAPKAANAPGKADRYLYQPVTEVLKEPAPVARQHVPDDGNVDPDAPMANPDAEGVLPPTKAPSGISVLSEDAIDEAVAADGHTVEIPNDLPRAGAAEPGQVPS